MLTRNWISQKEILPNPRKWDSGRVLLFAGELSGVSFIGGGSVSPTYQFENHSSVLLTSTDGAAVQTYRIGGPYDLSAKSCIEILAWCDTPANLSEVNLYLDPNSNMTRYAAYNFKTRFNDLGNKPGWRRLRVLKSAFSLFHDFAETDWANITRVQLKVTSTADTTVSVALAAIEALNTKPILIINFDDGDATVYTNAKPIMDNLGLRGVAYVITSQIGQEGKITLSQLRELQRDGWDVASHTHTHINLATALEADIRTELSTARAILKRYGFHKGANFVAAPGGNVDVTKADIYFSYCKAIRGSSAASPTVFLPPQVPVEGYPWTNYTSVGNTDTPATIQTWIDDMIAKGTAMNMVFHLIIDPADVSTKYTPTDFQTVMDYVAQKRDAGQLEVLTPSEFYYQTVGHVIEEDGKANLWGKRGGVPVMVDLEL